MTAVNATSLQSGSPQLPRRLPEGPSAASGAGAARVTTTRRKVPILLALATALLAGLLAAGCGYDDAVKDGGPLTTVLGTDTTPTTTGSTDATPEATTTTDPDDSIEISVYFSLEERMQPVHRRVPMTKAVAAAAMKALLEGPTAEERELGLFTSIPEGTLFLGVEIEGTVARVDLSREYESGGGSSAIASRLSQVVYTLTQFPTIDAVKFALDGQEVDVFSGEGFILEHPISRADYEEWQAPPILVESPAIGDTVTSPMRIWGTSNVFEATSQFRIVDGAGRTLIEQHVTATSGTGERGSFDVTIPFEAEPGSDITLIAFEYSAKDGSMVNIVRIPLKVAD